MSTEQNKEIVRRLIDEAFVRGRPDAMEELVTEDFTPRTWPSVEPGVESMKQAVTRMAATLSDVHMEVEDIIAEGDRVAVRLTAHAVPTGDFMGIPAAGRGYTISEIHIFRLEDGRIAEHWHVIDGLAMMRQLQAAPS